MKGHLYFTVVTKRGVLARATTSGLAATIWAMQEMDEPYEVWQALTAEDGSLIYRKIDV